MNKKELKQLIKPLVKECINEVLLQEGVLSSIISEVMIGTQGAVLQEQATPAPQKPTRQLETDEQAMQRIQERQRQASNQKRKLLDAIGKDAYNGVDLFEGTTPAPAPREGGRGPLSGVDPNDPGVDISSFMGSGGSWKKLAGN